MKFLGPGTVAIHDWPGANIHRQLLMELLHIEAEGSVIRHFERFMDKFLAPKWSELHHDKGNIYIKIDSHCREYFKRNYMDPLPYSRDFNHWKFAFSGENKLRFFIHCPTFIAPFIDERIAGLEERWNAIKLHSSIVERLCRFRISKDELTSLQEDIKLLHSALLDLYPDIATLNTHYETHLVSVIKRYLHFSYQFIFSDLMASACLTRCHQVFGNAILLDICSRSNQRSNQKSGCAHKQSPSSWPRTPRPSSD